MDILTKTISLFFRSRQQKIRRYSEEAVDLQQQQLRYILYTARKTEWGRRYDFSSVHTWQDFQERIPVQNYETLKGDIARMINGERNILWPTPVRWFAKSSGTTNDKSKFLPVTDEILKKAHYLGGIDTVALYLENTPGSNFFSHKGLILGGSHAPSPLNKNMHCGDLSAVLIQNLNPLVNLIRVPEKRIILMDEWESKIKAIVESTCCADVNSLSGVPSWMLVLIRAILRHTGREFLTDVWPNLEVFFHGGISFEPYREQYKALIPSEKMHFMETYNASEGFFGIQDNPDDKSLLLMLDYGIFYEFIHFNEVNKENPEVIPLESVETGKNYAMLISTPGGLWRYVIGDTVRFTSLRPYKFVISGRTKHFINAFGEELMVDNADKALAKTCLQMDARVRDYTVAPLFMLDKAKGRHQWLIEFDKLPQSIANFAAMLDSQLQSLNSDYEAKRYKEISLQPLEVIVVSNGSFYEWLKRNGKAGGQHKIPRLSNDRKILEEIWNVSKELAKSL